MLTFAFALFALSAVLDIVVALAIFNQQAASRPVALAHRAADAGAPNTAP